jgi:hypothetical protein
MLDACDTMLIIENMTCIQDRIDYCASVGIEYERLLRYYRIVRAMDHAFVGNSR